MKQIIQCFVFYSDNDDNHNNDNSNNKHLKQSTIKNK